MPVPTWYVTMEIVVWRIFVHARLAAAIPKELFMLFAQMREKIILRRPPRFAWLHLNPPTTLDDAVSVRELDVAIEQFAIT